MDFILKLCFEYKVLNSNICKSIEVKDFGFTCQVDLDEILYQLLKR